jgi:hypothetical protein
MTHRDVLPALIAGVHVFSSFMQHSKTWMAGTSPGHDGRTEQFKMATDVIASITSSVKAK